MPETITAALVQELYEAEWHDLPVISRDAGGWYQVEPQPSADRHGREVIRDANALDVWGGGQPLGEADFARFAAELTAEAAERDTGPRGVPLGAGDINAVLRAALDVARIIDREETWDVDGADCGDLALAMTRDIASFTITTPDGDAFTVAVSPVR